MFSSRVKDSVTSISVRSEPQTSYIHRFRRDENGGMMIFSLFIFIMMIMAGSLAVDFMRLESERARLQTSIDRAVLAGAALDQTLDQREVITDYLEKSGVKGYVPDDQIIVVDNGRERSAKVTGMVNIDTILMQFIGINQLAAAAVAKADESTPHVEVSMVLDRSGSMNNGGRIEKLQEAAVGFVNILIDSTQNADTSSLKTISIVPYAASVSVGEDLLALYNVNTDTEHDFSSCAEFTNAEFTTTALSTTLLLEQYPHYTNAWHDNNDSQKYEEHDFYGNGEWQLKSPRCLRISNPNSTTKVEENAILAFQTQSGDGSPLVEHIQNLSAGGSTSIDIGVKWGLALLDPGSRDVNASLLGENVVEDIAAGRPLDFDPSEGTTRKILVLMTDGMMNWDVPPREEFRDRPSNVFYNEETKTQSILLRGQIRARNGVVSAMERVASGNQNDTLPGNDWYWIDEEKYMPWPDSPAARIAWPYIIADDRFDANDRFDEAALNTVMDSLPNTDFNGIRSTDQQAEDKADWERRADWTYIIGDDTVVPSVDAAIVRLSHPALFDMFTTIDLRDDFLRKLRRDNKLSRAEWDIYETLWANQKGNTNASNRMIRLCNIAKGLMPNSPLLPAATENDPNNDRNITIYSVAMNLNTDERGTIARNLMRNCATRGDKYFKDTDTNGIVDAFREIALDVKALRLTQ